jgi:HK97 gp10 family phage protein
MSIKIVSRIPEAKAKIKDEAFQRMVKAVNAVRNETLVTLSGNRSGRIYRVPGTMKTYTASSPGEPPAVATGQLRQSVRTQVDNSSSMVIGYVGSTLIYAPCLEFGTKKMSPRPWLKPSFEKSEPKLKDILGGTWQI